MNLTSLTSSLQLKSTRIKGMHFYVLCSSNLNEKSWVGTWDTIQKQFTKKPVNTERDFTEIISVYLHEMRKLRVFGLLIFPSTI